MEAALERKTEAMARLDAEEAEANASTRVIEPSEALGWLRDLPALWTSADDSGRRLLTETPFEKVKALAVQSVTIHPTPEADAHGGADTFGPVQLPLDAGRAAVGMAPNRLSRDPRGASSLCHRNPAAPEQRSVGQVPEE